MGFFFLKIYLLITCACLWLHWVFVAVVGFLQVLQASAACSLWLQASHCGGFSCCGAWAPGAPASEAAAHGLQSSGLAIVLSGRSSSGAGGVFSQGSNPAALHW